MVAGLRQNHLLRACWLQDCDKLRQLDLSQNDIGDEGAVQLAQFLSLAPSLEALELSKSRIGPTGAMAFATVLPSCQAMVRLGLEENLEFGAEARAALCAAQGVAAVSPLRGAIGMGS